MKALGCLKLWLLVVYPVAAVLVGAGCWLFLAWRFPHEPERVLYSVAMGLAAAASWYLQTLWHHVSRKSTHRDL